LVGVTLGVGVFVCVTVGVGVGVVALRQSGQLLAYESTLTTEIDEESPDDKTV
jgi:hypothetical protein